MFLNVIVRACFIVFLIQSPYAASSVIDVYDGIKNKDSISGIYGLDGAVDVIDYSAHFKWIANQYFILVSSEKASYFLNVNDGLADVINNSFGFVNEDKIKAILYKKYSNFPESKVKYLEFMRDLSALYMLPGGKVGSRDFWDDLNKMGVVDSWLQAKEKSRSIFKGYCKDPSVKADKGQNKWELSYFVFNVRGGVNHFDIYGSLSPFVITKVVNSPVKDDGTFSYPIIGG